jgi:two-component system nitrogen regulation response regulator GlnG
VIRQAFLNANGPVLLPDFLPEALRHTPAALGPDTAGPAPDGPSPLVTFIRSRLSAGSRRIYEETVEHVERVLLPLVLEQTGGNQLRAAALLGVTRRTLRNKLRELGLTVTRTVDETGGADD